MTVAVKKQQGIFIANAEARGMGHGVPGKARPTLHISYLMSHEKVAVGELVLVFGVCVLFITTNSPNLQLLINYSQNCLHR